MIGIRNKQHPSGLSRHGSMRQSISLPRVIAAALIMLACGTPSMAQSTTVSNVDTSLSGSQKYLLRVEGKPVYPSEIQIRLDKLRYFSAYLWDAAQRDAIVGQAASDGFTTVAIPIQWYEVEPSKDNFDWTILDEYLGLCLKYNLKMEMLWFGANSGGHVEWLGNNSAPVHLRTPDYVLYSPAYGSTATTSDYTIDRSYSNYTLDMTDANLKARETYVLSQVMAHIASWDAAHLNPHTVVGVQINNEATGPWSSSQIVGYLSAVASAVKNSSYVVWTRMNTVVGDTTNRTNANESLRSNGGTDIDFVGIDEYTSSASTIQTAMPSIGNNFRMIMENGAEVSDSAVLQLSALSGNQGISKYDMIGPDGHGLYVQTAGGGFTPNGSYISDVRLVNHLLDDDPVDLALGTQGNSWYVHNWAGNSTSATTGGSASVTYTPTSTTDQAVSIYRSTGELVLMNMKGGEFTYPSFLQVNGASQGYFDSNNNWVNQGSVAFTNTSIIPPAGATVRLTMPAPLSLNQPATSSSYQTGHNPSQGNDGILTNRWTANGSTYPQWWTVDLGSSQAIKQATINWYNTDGRYYTYTIGASNDGVNYTTIVNKTGNTTPGTSADTFSTTARYVRVTVTGVSISGKYAAFWDCSIY